LSTSKYAFVRELVASLGPRASLHYAWQGARRRSRHLRSPYTLRSKHSRFALWCRANSSDLSVFGQIFIQREYRCLDAVPSAGLIIDCGANTGYSAAYFLTRFSSARVIAIEPDPENYAMLCRNLASYGARATCIRAGVWSHSTTLALDEAQAGIGREWARTVRPARAGEKDSIKAVDVGSLLQESGAERISILKVDIEGSEREVFARNTAEWLPRVDHIVVELHGDDCARVFDAAIRDLPFVRSTCDELTVCQRLPVQG
jgi:FkbM family methyltransferase